MRRVKRPLPQLHFQDIQGAPENEQTIVEMIQVCSTSLSSLDLQMVI